MAWSRLPVQWLHEHIRHVLKTKITLCVYCSISCSTRHLVISFSCHCCQVVERTASQLKLPFRRYYNTWLSKLSAFCFIVLFLGFYFLVLRVFQPSYLACSYSNFSNYIMITYFAVIWYDMTNKTTETRNTLEAKTSNMTVVFHSVIQRHIVTNSDSFRKTFATIVLTSSNTTPCLTKPCQFSVLISLPNANGSYKFFHLCILHTISRKVGYM